MAKSPATPAKEADKPETKTEAAPGRKLRYEARPALDETFADIIERMTFDGRTLRIEFCVVRPEEDGTHEQSDGKKIPVCRLVLDLDGAVDLFNKFNSLQAVLEDKGVIRRGV